MADNSILDYEITYWMNPSSSSNYGNKDCERLHHDRSLGTMEIGFNNLKKLQKRGLTIISKKDKDFLKNSFLISEHDPILKERLELIVQSHRTLLSRDLQDREQYQHQLIQEYGKNLYFDQLVRQSSNGKG
ncbi:hypothetical protein [Francisella sp. SYW-9]|uniref:hypothetical protein n=1 Tax=Francisella sp. SYW-9 TaxID=2610888 RepID=UPI00123DF5DE|nr:hypothetical protein [Francisella sp. SYW-9]